MNYRPGRFNCGKTRQLRLPELSGDETFHSSHYEFGSAAGLHQTAKIRPMIH